jgi:hypothetical protein
MIGLTGGCTDPEPRNTINPVHLSPSVATPRQRLWRCSIRLLTNTAEPLARVGEGCLRSQGLIENPTGSNRGIEMRYPIKLANGPHYIQAPGYCGWGHRVAWQLAGSSLNPESKSSNSVGETRVCGEVELRNSGFVLPCALGSCV